MLPLGGGLLNMRETPHEQEQDHGRGFAGLWRRLPDFVRSAVAVGSIFAAGSAVTLTLVGYFDLPQSVEQNAADIRKNAEDIAALKAKTEYDAESAKEDREELRALMLQTRCILLAPARGRPIEACLEPDND